MTVSYKESCSRAMVVMVLQPFARDLVLATCHSQPAAQSGPGIRQENKGFRMLRKVS